MMLTLSPGAHLPARLVRSIQGRDGDDRYWIHFLLLKDTILIANTNYVVAQKGLKMGLKPFDE